MSRLNNFDALRLLGAALVLVGHAYHLLGRGEQVPFMLGYPVSTLGVVIFFSISGYLIAASWGRSRDLREYFAARFLRIFPGLILVVVIAAFAMGPAVTKHPVPAYLQDPMTWDYLKNVALNPRYVLPGVFEKAPYPAAINGSLWTLPAEFFCYLVVPVVLGGANRSKKVGAALIAVALVVALGIARAVIGAPEVIYGSNLADAASMWVFFAAGSLLWMAHERWSGVFRADVAVLLMLGYLGVMAVRSEWVVSMSWAVLPYCVLVIGMAATPFVRRAARFGDFSYGTYLWGFPIQQLLVTTFGRLPMAVNLLLVGSLTLAAAAVSWHWVERPSMALRSRLIRRPKSRPVPVAEAG